MEDVINEQRTVEESYASATGASHLRIEAHRSGPADVVAAAGMNPYRTGMALMRLRSEWDRASKPKPPQEAEVQAAARTLPVEPATKQALVTLTKEQVAEVADKLEIDPKAAQAIDWRAIIEVANPHAGLVRTESEGKIAYRKRAREAEVQAHRWHQHELKILLQGLKTLPAVRAELERWVGGDQAPRLVADVLLWWLDPVCKTCGGCGVQIVDGTGGRSKGKACPDCRHITKSGQKAGERLIPFGGDGRRLVNHLNACYHTATGELRQTLKRRRTPQNVEQREQAKKDAQIAKLRQADEEAQADTARDSQKDAERFAQSLTRRKLQT